MSDVSQGPGYWQASDGRWYPPETHPDYKPLPAPPPLPPPPTIPAAGISEPSGWAAPATTSVLPTVPEIATGYDAPSVQDIPVLPDIAIPDVAVPDVPTFATGSPISGTGSSPTPPLGDQANAWPASPLANQPPPAASWSPPVAAAPTMPPVATSIGTPPGQAWAPGPQSGPPPGQPWAPGPQPGPPPPGQPWAPGPQTGPPKSGGMPGWAKALLIIIGIFVVLGVLVGGCAIVFANRASNALNDAFGTAKVSDYDVTLSDCSLDGSSPSAEGTLTNTSKKRQGFQVEVEFFDGKKTLLGTGTDFVGAIDVGTSATWSASAFETTQAAQIECQVARVSYSFLDR